MESTAFNMLVLPVVLATAEALAACCLAAKVADWAGRVTSALSGRADEAGDPWTVHGREQAAGGRRVESLMKQEAASHAGRPSPRRRPVHRTCRPGSSRAGGVIHGHA